MSHTHVGVFERSSGGQTWQAWINDKVVSGSSRSGEGVVNSVTSDSRRVILPVRNAVLILKNLTSFHGSDTGFTATPGVVTDVTSAWKCLGCDTRHNHMTDKDGLVPLYFSNGKMDKYTIQQAARWNISKGKNNAGMKDSYVGGMYVRSTQILVFAIAQEISRKQLAKQFDVLLYLVKAARHYADNHSDCAKVYDASARDVNLQDTLERVVAFMLTDSVEFNPKRILRCLEVSLKRGFRRGGWQETNLTENTGLLTGLVSVLLIAPMIKKFLVDGLDVADVVMEYENKTKCLLDILLKKKCSSVDILHYLMVDVAGLTATKNKVGKFYAFCRNSKNYKNDADLSRFGFIEEVVAPFDFRSSPSVWCENTSASSVRVECSTNGWGAIELPTRGMYRLSNFKTIGVVAQGKGNTLGNKFVANFRVTANKNLEFLPKFIEGKSSAGKHYHKNYGGKWSYTGSSLLVMTLPIIIIIRHGSFTVMQDNEIWFSMSTDDPVVLGFKKYEFQIEKIETLKVPVKKASSSYASAIGGGSAKHEVPEVPKVDADDVCAMALARYVSSKKKGT